ncbi:DUF2958 domain-containing protein [Variovorax paradoxus]
MSAPGAWATWLRSEIDSEGSDVVFGLCNLELGCPEPGP